MKNLTTDNLIQYVLRPDDPSLSREVERQAADDPELAAKLRLMARSVGVVLPDEAGAIAARSGPRLPRRTHTLPRWLKRAVVVLAALLLGSGLAWAAVSLLKTPALLEDDFETNWGDLLKWETPRRVVKVEGGHVRLFDRGYLVTMQEFPEPIELTFRWRWTDLAGDFRYRDELTIALRTSGVPREAFAHEATDGILVKINATAGKLLIAADDIRHRFLDMDEGTLPLPAEQWQWVRITDDGTTIAVFIAGPNADRPPSEPMARVKVPGGAVKRRIAFYNRERLAGASHESWIDDIVIRPLQVPVRSDRP